jgi:hypothetical protein
VVIYGFPYDEGNVEFIDELHLILSSWGILILVIFFG